MQPGSLTKIIQGMFDGKRTEIDWSVFNDPRAMKVWREEHVEAVADLLGVEGLQGEAIQDRFDGDNADIEPNVRPPMTYQDYEAWKAAERRRTRTAAAFQKKVDDMTHVAMDPKVVKAKKSKPAAYQKALTDVRAKIVETLQTEATQEPATPRDPRLDVLATKRLNGGKSVKFKKNSAGHRSWGGISKVWKAKKEDEVN